MNPYCKIDQKGNNDNELQRNMVNRFSFTSNFCDVCLLNKMDINYERKCKININNLKMEKNSSDFKWFKNIN